MKNTEFLNELLEKNAVYERRQTLDELNLIRTMAIQMNVISPANVGSYVAPKFSQSLLAGAAIGAANRTVSRLLAE